MLLCVASWNSVPSYTKRLHRAWNPAVNSGLEYMSAFYKFYSTSDKLPYIVDASNYPDAVLRDYRGVSGVDAWGSAGSSSATTSANATRTSRRRERMAKSTSPVLQTINRRSLCRLTWGMQQPKRRSGSSATATSQLPTRARCLRLKAPRVPARPIGLAWRPRWNPARRPRLVQAARRFIQERRKATMRVLPLRKAYPPQPSPRAAIRLLLW